MRATLFSGAMFSIATLASCTAFTPVKVVGDPSEVTIEQALKSVGDGLRVMRAAIGEDKTGLIPAEVTVNFKLAASAKDGSKLTVDLSVPLTSGGAAGTATAGGEATKSSEGTRSNEITIKFVNLLLVPKETLATIKNPAELHALIEVLKGQGITTMFAPVPKLTQ